LDLPTKTLTELEESKPLQLTRDKEVSAQIMALKKPATTDRSMDPIRIARPEQSRQRDETGKERTEKHKELDKAPVEFDYKRNGGIFIAQQNKLS
jgi:hypothetical protein